MENRAHALAAGLFVIFLSVAMAAAAMWLSGETVIRDSYLLESKGSVSGLNPQAAVRYRGVDVGKVEDIRFDPENPRNILIGIAVDRSVVLTKGVFAQLGYQGVTGLAYVQLDDDGKHPERLQGDAGSLVRIPVQPSLLEKITDSGQDLLGNANEAVKRVNLLMSDRNQTRFSKILENVEGASGRFDDIANQLQPGLKALPGLAAEASVVLKRTDRLLTDLSQVTLKANQQGGAIDNLSQSAGELADTLPKLHDASDGVTRATRSVDRAFLQLEEQPRSLLFGRAPPPPGPGEDGFVPIQGVAR